MNPKPPTLFRLLLCSVIQYGQAPAQKKWVEELRKYAQKTKRLTAEMSKEQQLLASLNINGKHYGVFILDSINLSHSHGAYPKPNVRLYFEHLGEKSKLPYSLLMSSVLKKDVPMHSLHQEYLFVDSRLCTAYDQEYYCGESLRYYRGKGIEHIYSKDSEEK